MLSLMATLVGENGTPGPNSGRASTVDGDRAFVRVSGAHKP